jgi:hypothetical protein
MKGKIDPALAKRLTEEQIKILEKSIKEKREIPIRIVYVGEYWDKIAKDQTYQLAEREVTALKNSIQEVSKKIGSKKVNVIHLGPGNGMEIPFILQSINPNQVDTYALVDLNSTMLDLSEKRMKKDFPSTKIKKFLRDIETYGIKDICDKVKEDGAKINLIVLIANGVLFSNEDFVKEIKNSMNKEDFFYITLELYEEGKDKEIIKPYLIPSVLDLLSNGLKLLGYSPSYDEFYGEIDKKDDQLKIYFVPNGNRERKLLVLHSYKTKIEKLKERMKRLKFKESFCEEYENVHACGGLYII